jgi:hypothetical protein
VLTHAAICDFVAASYSQQPTWQAGDDIRAVGTRIGDEFVVACPGTTDLAGWLDDFSIWPTSFPVIGPYHTGFGLWGLRLWALVNSALPVGGRLIFAGHSLGGQLALVLAASCAAAMNKHAPMRVVTFGCPRGAFGLNLVAGPLARTALELVEYRNYGDPIPDVPPWPMWKHAKRGTMIGAPIHAQAPSMANHAIALYQTNLKAKPAPAPSAWRGTAR